MAAERPPPSELWTLGDYASIGELWAGAGEQLVARIGVAGLAVLDVATGTGNTALAAGTAGAARIVGLDTTVRLLDEAARRAATAGLQLETELGDMEDLPFADDSFDRVLSSFGAMFAADQARTAAGLVRVCRPGGRIGLTAWSHGSVFDRMGHRVQAHLPGSLGDGPSPRDWASAEALTRIFAALPVQISVEEAAVPCRLASPETLVELMETQAGAYVLARRSMGEASWADARAALVEVATEVAHCEADGQAWRIDLGYTLALVDVAR